MKKEENDTKSALQPKNESYDEFVCPLCNKLFISEIEFKKHKLSHKSAKEDENFVESVNGCTRTNEIPNDLDDSHCSQTTKSLDNKFALKKEELSEEKFIVDDEIQMNKENDMNDFQTESNDDFSFSLNIDEDLPNNFLNDEENSENPLSECEHNTLEFEESEATDEGIENEDGSEETNDNSEILNNAVADDTGIDDHIEDNNCDNDEGNMSENENEKRENSTLEMCTDNISTEKDTLQILSSDKDQSESENKEQTDTSEIAKNTEEFEKENEKDCEIENAENKRPSSRESTTSTASSSSERTLIVRSASQVNKTIRTVLDSSEVVVKTEKLVQESSSEKVEKPGLSVLNPSQLGARNIGGENLLSGSFVQSSDQMINYMPSNLQNGVPSFQCDVCETQFTESMVLEEHKLTAGHYKCHCSPECTNFIFQSIAELVSHQQTAHGMINQSPVQQLQHQVQSIPIPYQIEQPVGNTYQTMPSFQPSVTQQPRNVVPTLYSNSQSNVQMRQYNLQSSPRIQLNSVRGSVSMANQTNNLKRGPTSTQGSRMTPPKRRCLDNYSNRNGDADCKVVSVQKPDNTNDVVAQLSKSITITTRQENPKKNDTAAVTNMLANRGITVSSVPSKQTRNSNAVTMLNLNSAVSLIPTNNNNNYNSRQNSGFAVPQGRISANRQAGSVSGRMQTVDLTGPDPPRNKQLSRTSRFTCQICDRSFFNQDQLNQHMITHRNVSRKQLPYKCNTCTAQYPNQQSLIQHRQTCHRDAVNNINEMVIPIVDLKQPGALHKLQSIGIHYMIPLNALGSQSSNGSFGIPILPFSSDKNAINNMTNCGISNILPVGPLKALGR